MTVIDTHSAFRSGFTITVARVSATFRTLTA